MKKNININLFGTLYAIDEDACKLLENYLDNMRSYFARRDGGDEIADDIEHRVAEHLWTLKEQGLTAIDIDTVKSVIESIGNPSQVDGGDGDDSDVPADGAGTSADASTDSGNSTDSGAGGSWADRVMRHVRTHRFYRDGRDKMAGGVMSGLCHYCGGGDTVVWRIAAVMLVIATFSFNQMTRYTSMHRLSGVLFVLPVILYILLWLLAPVAKTTEERLCMKGDEVTPESLGRAVIAEAGEADSATAARRRSTTLMGRIMEIALFCIKLCGMVAFAVMSAFAVAFFVCGIIYAVAGVPFLQLLGDSPDFVKAVASIPMLGGYWIATAVCCLVATLLPLMGILRSFKAERKPLSLATTATLVVAWIVAVVVSILMFVLLGICIDRENSTLNRVRNTRNGIYLDQWNWELLDREGWQVSAVKNISGGVLYEYAECDPLRLGNRPLCLRPEKAGAPVGLAMSRRENLEPGDYVLECMADCSLTDATLSVWSGGKCLAQLRLDGYGASANHKLRGVSWQESRTLPLFDSQSDSTVWVDEVQGLAFDGDADWHYLASPSFGHGGGMVEYRLRIGQHDIPDGSAVCGRMWLDHVGVRKLNGGK